MTLVLSKETRSILTLMICSRCRAANTRSRTPLFDHLLAFMYMEFHLPNSFGRPLHLQPCSARYSSAFRNFRLPCLTFPLCTGSRCSILLNSPDVILMH